MGNSLMANYEGYNKSIRQTKKKKKPVNKNQRCKPIHQKYKANESISRHNSKNKKKTNKQSIKIEYKPYAKKTHGYEMIINNKKKNLK
jgi:hypothetical protein